MSEEGEEPQIEESAEPTISYTPREPLVSPEVQDVINLRRFMEGEKETKPEKSAIDRLMETMIVDYLMDRMEERRKGKRSPSLTPEDIAKAVTEAIKPLIPQKQEEMPEWAKDIQKQQKDILQRLTKEEEEEKTKKIIEETQRPLLDQIKERDHIIEKLQERLNELSEKYENLGAGSGGGGGSGKDKLDVYLEIDEKLKTLGIKKEPKPGTVWLSDEEGPIPVSGELPAWVVYGPIVADKIMTAVEKRLNNIASRWMELAQPPQPEQPQPKREELIRLPPKPQMPEETKEAPKEEVKPAEEFKTEVEVKRAHQDS